MKIRRQHNPPEIKRQPKRAYLLENIEQPPFNTEHPMTGSTPSDWTLVVRC
jgi:hypothetical protein